MIPDTILMNLDSAGFIAAKNLLSLSWQFLLLFAAVFIMTSLMKRTSARIRYALWISVFYMFPVVALLVFTAGRLDTPKVEMRVMPAYSADIPVEVHVNQPQETVTNYVASVKAANVSVLDYPWLIIFLIYCTGAAGFLGLVALGRLRISHWRNNGWTVTESRITDTFRSAAIKLGIRRRFGIVESDSISVPLTAGTLRPAVLLPAGYADRLSDSDLYSLALHELAHVKRLDSMAFAFVSVVRAVFFFNPLVWYAARQVSMLAENACDDIVIEADSNPLDYAEMLVRLARTLPEHALKTELAAGFILTKRCFFRRVEQILADRKQRITRLSKRALAGCFAAGLALMAIVASVPVGEVSGAKNPGKNSDGATARNIVFRARVIDSETGNPVKGVRLFETNNRDNKAVSDKNGIIELPGFTTGIDTVTIEGDEIGRLWAFNMIRDAEVVFVKTLCLSKTISFNIQSGMEPVTFFIQPAVTISGRVLDPDGNPVAGATVAPTETGNGTFITNDTDYKARTDSNGRYTILLPASIDTEYNLIAHDGDLNEWRKWANGVSKPMKTKPGQVLRNIDIRLTRPATLSGIVVDSEGKPKASHNVLAFTGDGLSNLYYEPMTKTDSNGRFEFANVRPGDNWILTMRLIPNEKLYEQARKGTIKKISVSSDQSIKDIRLVGFAPDRPPMDSLEGSAGTSDGNIIFKARVIDSETGKPVEGVRLFVERSKPEIQGISDRTGAVEISNLEQGKLGFWVEGKGIGRWWSSESLEYRRRNAPNTVVLPANGFQRDFDTLTFEIKPDMKPVTIEVERAVTMSGTVYDPDGSPVPAATVSAAVTGQGSSPTGDTRFNVRTDNHGKYELVLPASKSYKYNLVAHDGDIMVWRKWANGVTKPIQTEPGQVVNNLDITLTKPCTVRGTVVDTSGKSKAGQDVRAHAADGTGNSYYDPMTKTDENGNFVLSYIRPGEHWIVGSGTNVTIDGVREYAPQDVMRKVTIASGQTLDNIRLVGYGRDELLKAMKPKDTPQ